MDDKIIINLIETTLREKINNAPDYIRYSYYELKVKYNLSEQDIDRFLDLTRTKLQNNNYRVYFTGAKFVYKNANITVQPNEFMIAVKEIRK